MGEATGRIGYVENLGYGENAALRTAIGRYYEQRPDPESLHAEVRDATLVVPVRHGREVYTADHGGVRWILAFTSRAALARFAVTRAELRPPYWFITVTGARLLDSFTRAIAKASTGASTGASTRASTRVTAGAIGTAVSSGGVGAVGVAVDVGGEQPVLLPPQAGTPLAGSAATGLDASGVGGG